MKVDTIIFAAVLALGAPMIIVGIRTDQIDADTRAKLERVRSIEAEIHAARAARYAKVLAACLNGEGFLLGEQHVACRLAR